MGGCRRIRERFQHVYLSQSTLIHLSLTVSGVTSTGFKRYEDMYDCVCRKVREIKRSKSRKRNGETALFAESRTGGTGYEPDCR